MKRREECARPRNNGLAAFTQRRAVQQLALQGKLPPPAITAALLHGRTRSPRHGPDRCACRTGTGIARQVPRATLSVLPYDPVGDARPRGVAPPEPAYLAMGRADCRPPYTAER